MSREHLEQDPGETVTNVDLAGSPKSPIFVAIYTKHAFTSAGNKIRLLVMEVLL